ncbi:MAG: FAD-dependent monooxygenase [Anaerolineae bacterium]|nr:FAD-dependent monooxygenase [Anaerolineae bacterium]
MFQQTMKTDPGSHAVVIGGSIAGMLTARVLTNHFDRVTVIERDALPETPEFRKGAPHARHAHGLLARGQQIMESLFPGLTEELQALGAIPTNMGRGLNLYVGGVRVQPFESEIEVTISSRPLLENAIYRRLRTLPGVSFLLGYDVTGLTTDEERQKVTGISLRQRGQGNQEEQTLAADLVVDASGRGSRLPQWLEALGYQPPSETSVDSQTAYMTRVYRRTATTPMLYAMPQAPDHARGCIVIPVEGDRMLVTLIGLNGEQAPTDEAGFLAYARSLPVPGFYETIVAAEPLTEPYGFQRAANRLRHYDKLPRYLEGVLAIGDSFYALNPVYGQGMTVAALGALTLNDCLYDHRQRATATDMTGLARTFHKKLAKVNAGPWQLATGQDLRWPCAAEGYRPDPVTRLIQRYFDRLLVAMADNGELAEAFSQVQNMLKPPTSLFHPRIVWQALRSGSQAGKPANSRPAMSEGDAWNTIREAPAL